MEGVLTTGSIGSILAVAALLGCLSLPRSVDARGDGQATAVRDSVVPIVVISASPLEPDAGRVELTGQPEDRSAGASNDAAPGVDIALDGPADAWAPLADVPLAAWLLLGTCVLCAGFGRRALRRFEDDAQDTAPPNLTQHADLTGPV